MKFMRKLQDFIATIFAMSSYIKLLQINLNVLLQFSSMFCCPAYKLMKKSYKFWRILTFQCQVKSRNWIKALEDNTLKPIFVEGNGSYGRPEDLLRKLPSK